MPVSKEEEPWNSEQAGLGSESMRQAGLELKALNEISGWEGRGRGDQESVT